ncbi:hypothetical protein V491_07679 [Pseudogymnoascus sp. VKM F-3775]|nr:hypothetical protein V491_07679 [Pseudogymnoascus sp. VKM F-3775]
MPLVAPEITGDVVPQTQEWTNRLLGKTIGDETTTTTFAMSELPENSRIIPEGQPTSPDFNENRRRYLQERMYERKHRHED